MPAADDAAAEHLEQRLDALSEWLDGLADVDPARALAAAAADLDVGGEDAALTLAAWTLWSRAENFAAVGDEDLLS
ncbi:hypothetical protein [Actinacidiphila oryziradicis]|uniref:Uncharacterized protein n=1 Tax=Actinacidiphila oryziradicis TaxID=2571141 RepID=A0A4U0SLN8_9ACTN|nr:hypothetical protein [Actinacidiphila oryziradicis]TKA01225.1 hypothetical protein FCI23_40940 [Actinacidiphila oryziradicis]